MDLLVIFLVLAALIIVCVVHVALRQRRGSGDRRRFEPGPQGAPYSAEAGINEQGHRNGNASAL